MPKRKLKWVHLESGAILDDDTFQKYIEAFDMPPYVQTPTEGRWREGGVPPKVGVAKSVPPKELPI